MTLEIVDYINGISCLIYVVVSIIVGLKILSIYSNTENRDFIFVGITWIGMSEPTLPMAISFFWNLIFHEGLSFVPYVILGIGGVPFFIFCWMVAFTDLLYKAKQKIILMIYAITGILFEIVFFASIIINPNLIGVFEGAHNQIVHLDFEYRGFTMVYILFGMATILITGILFARESLRSEIPEIKLKGKFLLSAFLAWVIGGFLDAIIPLNPITLPFIRLLFLSSALLFYIGYILPPNIRKLILKE